MISATSVRTFYFLYLTHSGDPDSTYRTVIATKADQYQFQIMIDVYSTYANCTHIDIVLVHNHELS